MWSLINLAQEIDVDWCFEDQRNNINYLEFNPIYIHTHTQSIVFESRVESLYYYQDIIFYYYILILRRMGIYNELIEYFLRSSPFSQRLFVYKINL